MLLNTTAIRRALVKKIAHPEGGLMDLGNGMVVVVPKVAGEFNDATILRIADKRFILTLEEFNDAL